MTDQRQVARHWAMSAALPLLMASLGLAGLLSLGRALSELLLIFECSGAVGGGPATPRRSGGGPDERRV